MRIDNKASNVATLAESLGKESEASSSSMLTHALFKRKEESSDFRPCDT